jgi:hypothetical protein
MSRRLLRRVTVSRICRRATNGMNQPKILKIRNAVVIPQAPQPLCLQFLRFVGITIPPAAVTVSHASAAAQESVFLGKIRVA